MPWSLVLISLIALCSVNTLTELKGATCSVNTLTELKGETCSVNTFTELKGATSQSSDYTGDDVDVDGDDDGDGDDVGVVHGSERAVDGKLHTCSHTQEEMNSWWRIDLRGVYPIDHITIYQTSDRNTDLDGAQIYIGNSREKNGTANRLCKSIGTFTNNIHKQFDCDAKLSGRFITVSFPGKHFLALCEVKIYGTKKESPFELVRINKTWVDALNHCRAGGTSLASVVDEDTQTWAELQANNSNSPFVWLGLRYTCTLEFWFWVENLPVRFSRWAPSGRIDDCDMSGAMEQHEDHSWASKSAGSAFNFICKK